MNKLNKALQDYIDKFNENYPIVITSNLQEKDIIQDIYRCIKNDKKKSNVIVMDDPDITADMKTILI